MFQELAPRNVGQITILLDTLLESRAGKCKANHARCNFVKLLESFLEQMNLKTTMFTPKLRISYLIAVAITYYLVP